MASDALATLMRHGFTECWLAVLAIVAAPGTHRGRGWSRPTEGRASAIPAIDVVINRHFGAASTGRLDPEGAIGRIPSSE